MKHSTVYTRRHQQGVTITEMMVALTVSMVLLGGVLEIYAGTKQTYRVQKALSRLQENGRFALEFLTRDLRMGGYQGCPNLDSVTPDDEDVTIGQSSITVSMAPASVTQGYAVDADGNWSATYAGLTSQPSNVVSGTDVLTLTFGGCEADLSADMTSVSAPVAVAANNCGFSEDDILIISDCGGSEVFQAAANTTDTSLATSGLSRIYTQDAKAMQFISRDYYIRLKTLANGTTIPGFYQRDLGGGNTQELIEGVEDIFILYGEETNPATGDIRYWQAGSVTDWSQVISVRVNLLLRTVEDNLAINPQTYTFAGSTVTPSDLHLRRTFTTTVNLRNRSL